MMVCNRIYVVDLHQCPLMYTMHRGSGGYLYVKYDNVDCRKVSIVPYEKKTHRNPNSRGIQNNFDLKMKP